MSHLMIMKVIKCRPEFTGLSQKRSCRLAWAWICSMRDIMDTKFRTQVLILTGSSSMDMDSIFKHFEVPGLKSENKGCHIIVICNDGEFRNFWSIKNRKCIYIPKLLYAKMMEEVMRLTVRCKDSQLLLKIKIKRVKFKDPQLKAMDMLRCWFIVF